jgi:hypothetical protein
MEQLDYNLIRPRRRHDWYQNPNQNRDFPAQGEGVNI